MLLFMDEDSGNNNHIGHFNVVDDRCERVYNLDC